MRNSLYLSLTLITCLTAFSPSLHAENEQHQHSHNSQKNTPNVANRERHPYVRAEEGRENYTLAGHQANEFRIYDFYQR